MSSHKAFKQSQDHKNYEKIVPGVWGPEWLTKHSAKFLPDCLDPQMAGDRGWIYDHVFSGYPLAIYDKQQPRLVLVAGERGDGMFDETTKTIFINVLQAMKVAQTSSFKAAVNFLTHICLHELLHSLTPSAEEEVERISLHMQQNR